MKWSPKNYDKVLVSFSGGKDSIACLKACLDAGVPLDRIELCHQCIDGRDPEINFMDWPVTEGYVRQLGKALGIPTYFQWREGGFARELWRTNQLTGAFHWENEDGTVDKAGGVRGKPNTRRMFPQVSANLSVRWCSALISGAL